MKCSFCNYEISELEPRCPQCGNPTPVRQPHFCKYCGTPINAQQTNCPKCQAPINETPAKKRFTVSLNNFLLIFLCLTTVWGMILPCIIFALLFNYEIVLAIFICFLVITVILFGVVGVYRLHDAGLSGWWIIYPVFFCTLVLLMRPTKTKNNPYI